MQNHVFRHADSDGTGQPVRPRSIIKASLSVNRIMKYYIMYEKIAKARMSFAHAQDGLNLHMFAHVWNYFA